MRETISLIVNDLLNKGKIKMAYERDNSGQANNAGNFQNRDAQNAFEQDAAQMRETASANTGNGLKNIFGMNTSLISRQTGGARLIKLQEEVNKIIKESGIQRIKLDAVKIDAEKHNLYVSSLALVAREASSPSQAYVYIYMLDKEVQPAPVTKNQGNGVITVLPVVTGSAYDDTYSDEVCEGVAEQLNLRVEDVKIVSACVILRDFDLENANGIMDLVCNGSYAINTLLEEKHGNTHFTLANVAANEILSVDPSYGREQVVDAAGYSRRADIQLFFNVKTQDANVNTLNGKGQSRTFGSIGAFMDVIQVAGVGQAVQQSSGWGQTLQNPKFNPLFVVNTMRTDQAGSLAAQLTMLMTIGTMAQGDEWVNSFYERNRLSKRQNDAIDVGEIGALNIAVNLPQYRSEGSNGASAKYGPIINTRNSDVTRESYITLLQSMFNQDMYVALDCPTAGAESWYMDRFRFSSENTDVGRVYAAQIQAAADELTEGRFSRAWNAQGGAQSLWLCDPIMMHNGYYIDHNQKRRDIKDIDTLTIYNLLGKENPADCAEWAASMNPQMNQDVALTVRKKLIENVAGGSNHVVYTGYSARLMLNPLVISVLLQCAASMNFRIRFSSSYQQNVNGFNTALNLSGGAGLNSQNIGGAFQGAFTGGGAGNGMNSGTFYGNGFGGSGGLKL